MRLLFCMNDLSHARFAEESDGSYHKTLVYDADKEQVLYRNVEETPTDVAPMRCDICGGDVLDLEDADALERRLKLFHKKIAAGRVAASSEDQILFLEALRAAHVPAVVDRINDLAKLFWRSDKDIA